MVSAPAPSMNTSTPPMRNSVTASSAVSPLACFFSSFFAALFASLCASPCASLSASLIAGSSFARLAVQFAQIGQFISDFAFQTTWHRLIPARLRHPVGEVGFAGSVGVRLVVRVAVFVAVTEFLHQLGWRVAQVDRHLARLVALDESHGGIEGVVAGVALGGDGQVDHGLPQRQLALGRTEAL